MHVRRYAPMASLCRPVKTPSPVLAYGDDAGMTINEAAFACVPRACFVCCRFRSPCFSPLLVHSVSFCPSFFARALWVFSSVCMIIFVPFRLRVGQPVCLSCVAPSSFKDCSRTSGILPAPFQLICLGCSLAWGVSKCLHVSL